MVRNKVKLAFLVACLCFLTELWGQDIPTEIPSPTVASLAKFGDVPVSMFTGTPRISIPIYELKALDKVMPISLDYDASGLQINSLPSWTGHNWSLQVGGVITRQRVGNYDDFILPKQALPNRELAKKSCYFKNYGRLKRFMQTKDNSELNPYFDQGPDVFIFNFMGHSGKFYLGNDGQWKVQSNENLDINFDIANFENDSRGFQYTPFGYPKPGAMEREPKTITGFTIRDEDGIQYLFGYTKNSVEFVHSFFNMSKNEDVFAWHASSWYLTAVYDKYDRLLFSLSYERGAYVVQAYNAFCMLSSAEHTDFGNFPRHSMDGSACANTDKFPYGFTVTSPVYLSRISNRAGVAICFSYSYPYYLNSKVLYGSLYNLYGTGLSKTDKIRKLYNDLASRVSGWGDNQSLWKNDNPASSEFYQPGAFYFLQNDKFREFRLTNSDSLDILGYTGLAQLNSFKISSKEGYIEYNFFYSTNKRLLLSHIMVTSANKWQHPVQNMGYDFSYINPSFLPSDYLSTQSDHWGYFNGKGYTKSPFDTVGYSDFDAIKEPDAEKMQMGMLKEITYPTGGTTEIEYEPNDYHKYLSSDRQSMLMELKNKLGGGVRVKSLTNWDSPQHNKVLKKTCYKYVDPSTGFSSGELFAKPQYYWKDWKVITSKNSYVLLNLFRTSSVISLGNSFGPHLGYSYVEEIDSADGSKSVCLYRNLSMGKKDQKFDFSLLSTAQSTPVDLFTEKGYERGQMIAKRFFDSRGKLVKSIGYEYNEGNEDFATYTSNMSQYYGKLSDANSFSMGGIVRLLCPKIKLKAVSDTTFLSSGNIITSKTYTNRDVQIGIMAPYKHVVDVKLLQQETQKCGNIIEIKSYSYPNFSENTPNGYQFSQYFNLNPDSQCKAINGKQVSRTYVVYKDFTRQTGKMHSETSYVPAFECVQYPMGAVDTLVTYESYYMDCSLNSYVKKGEAPTFIVWGYNDSFPISIQKGGQALNPYLYTNNWIVQKMYDPREHVEDISKEIIGNASPGAAFIYSPLYGVMQKIETNGNVTFYQYDGLGNLSGVFDKNGKELQHFDYSYKKHY